jgi:glycosidase
VRDHPSWISDAIVYGAVPKFFGGDLAAVTAQIDRLSALGVNTIWLSPVTASPYADFGYAVTDFFQVRDSLGSDAELHQLIDAVHARGMRIILDFVANHVSDQHRYFLDAVRNGSQSPYYDFFQRAHNGAAVHYFDWLNLENLNYQNEEVQRWIIDAFAYWVREFHVDGFRVDAAWGPRERAPYFWPRWRAELKRIDPDLLLIAEASARDPYYRHSGFDAAYDWTNVLGQWAWQRGFDDKRSTGTRLRKAIAKSPGRSVLRFLDNNDTGLRFIDRFGVAETRLAAAMLLTLPGIPALYTGDEVGASYKPYATNEALTWNDPQHMHAWYEQLIGLRRSEPALRSRTIRFLDTGPDRDILAYLREDTSEIDKVLVILNFGSKPARAAFAGLANVKKPVLDLLGGQTITPDMLNSGMTIEGYGLRIFRIG